MCVLLSRREPSRPSCSLEIQYGVRHRRLVPVKLVKQDQISASPALDPRANRSWQPTEA